VAAASPASPPVVASSTAHVFSIVQAVDSRVAALSGTFFVEF
jgi:hypothetical protein